MNTTSYTKDKVYYCLTFQQLIIDKVLNQSNLDEKLTTLTAGLASITLPTCIAYALAGNMTILILLCLNVKRPNHMEIYGCILILFDTLFVIVSCVYYIPQYFAWWSLSITALHFTSHAYCKLIFGFIDLFSAIRMNLILYMIILCLRKPQYYYYHSKMYGYLRLISRLIIILAVSLIQAVPTFVIYGLWLHDDICLCLPHPQWSYKYHKFYYIHKALYLECLIQSVISLLLSIPLWYKYNLDKQTYLYLNNQCTSRSLLTKILINLKLEIQGHRQNEQFLLIQIFTICLLKTLRGLCSLSYSMQRADLTNTRTVTHPSVYMLTLFSKCDSLSILEVIFISSSSVVWYITSYEIQLFCRYLRLKLFSTGKKSGGSSRAAFASLTSQDYAYLCQKRRLFHSYYQINHQKYPAHRELSIRAQKKVVQQLDNLKEHLLKMHAKDLKDTNVWKRYMIQKNYYMNYLHKIHDDEEQTLNELASSLDLDPANPLCLNSLEIDTPVDEEREEGEGGEGGEEEQEVDEQRSESKQLTIDERTSNKTVDNERQK
ncbi:unnamed protein product [Trichobilharzia szidati]|nr:unnamed protein product [Trichobilharzia szidati]